MKPLIGITPTINYRTERYELGINYVTAIEMAGGIPLILPPLEDGDGIQRLVGTLHGLLLSGGVDVDPMYFDEEPLRKLGSIQPERDAFELALTKAALKAQLPILAICRGIQILNIAAGGTVYQDINGLSTTSYKHSQDAPRWYPTHKLALVADSKLHRLWQTQAYRVNSFHHQAVAKVAPGFIVTAHSLDGIIEAIESTQHPFVIGVQWHPETMWKTDAKMAELFREFVRAC